MPKIAYTGFWAEIPKKNFRHPKNFDHQLGPKGFWEKRRRKFDQKWPIFWPNCEIVCENFRPFFSKNFKNLPNLAKKQRLLKNLLTIFWKISSRKIPESLNIVLLILKKLLACAVFGARIVTTLDLAPHDILYLSFAVLTVPRSFSVACWPFVFICWLYFIFILVY